MIDCPIPDADRKLLFDFFWKFSAFECALKRGGFLKPVRKDKRTDAQADWDKFARKIDGRFVEIASHGFWEAVARINCLSPQRQINAGGKLGWKPVGRGAKDSDTAYTLKLLRTARNNLFHGGKYQDGSIIPEIARDREILLAALTVLDGCYELIPR